MNIQLDQDGYVPCKRRLLCLQIAVLLFFLLFILRFWFLQVHKGEDYQAQSLNNRLRSEKIYALRGVISDKNGVMLAENRMAFGLTLIREDCKDIPSTLAQISAWSGVSLDRITAKYNSDKKKAKAFEPILLLSDIDLETALKIEANLFAYPGLQIVTKSKRTYPFKDTFAHILGYVADANEQDLKNKKISLGDTVGKQGLELVLEDTLRGQKGLHSVDVDVIGRELGRQIIERPAPGTNVQLAIDATIQNGIVDILGEQTGSVVVMNPDTGKILSIVTTPAYDNNLFTTGLSHKNWITIRDNPKFPLQNRGIQSTYPPGSVWKLMMAGLFLEKGINPKEEVFCGGETKLGNQKFRCWRKGGHGKVDLEQALVHSCDVYFYEVSQKVGIDAIAEFASASGFGKSTGIELPYEKGGLVPSREWKRKRFNDKWHLGETLHASIGQGYTLATPLQVAVFVSSLLNGGKILEPQVLLNKPTIIRNETPMSEKSRNFVLKAMQETVENQRGTARVLGRKDMVIGGKTGTAQVVKLRMDGERRLKTEEMKYFERDHAWMASYGIKGTQRLVVVAMIEHGGGGSSVAGPLVKQVYDLIFGKEIDEEQILAEKQKELQAQTNGISNAQQPAQGLN